MLSSPTSELGSMIGDSLPSASPRVVFCPVAEGAVLLSTEDEVYFGLNHVGARVWQLLPPTSESLGELCAVLTSEFPDAAPEVVREDVIELLEALRAYGLVA